MQAGSRRAARAGDPKLRPEKVRVRPFEAGAFRFSWLWDSGLAVHRLREVMRRPVRAEDGNVYDKKALEEYVRLSEASGELLSPVTQKPMDPGRFPKLSSFCMFHRLLPKPLNRDPALV